MTTSRHFMISMWITVCIAMMCIGVPGKLAAQQLDQPGLSEYRLGPGDELQVTVFGEADLTTALKINESGRVLYAFVGEFDFFHKTLKQAEFEILDRLQGDYLIDPQVTVSIIEFRPFYIYGEVNKPGSYAYEPGMNVRKAIALAGGLMERASSRKWFLIPEGGTEADRRQVNEDDMVMPGDSVTIEQSFF